MSAATNTPDMEVIKERVTQVLDNKGVLSRLKAELRANVFLAINDQDIQNGGVGVVLVELVREFLHWCGLQFTLQVFDPEMQLAEAAWGRSSLEQQLGVAGGSSPLLLQLLNQCTGQMPAQTPAAVTQPVPPASAATTPGAVSSRPTGATRGGINDSAQQQEQMPTNAVPLQADSSYRTAPGLVAAAAATPGAAKQPSKSGSIVADIEFDEDLINVNVSPEEDEEEYATVFLAAQGHSGTSSHDTDDSSNGSSAPQPQSRPVRAMQSFPPSACDQALAVAEAAAAPAKPDLSESFGQLDSDQASVSLELHGVDSPHAQVDSGTAVAAVAAAAATAAEPDNMGAGQIPNVGSFISPAGSIELHHQPWAPSLAAAAPAPGRLGVVEPLAPIRPNKLAPLPAVKGPGGPGSSSGSTTASPGIQAKTSGSEQLIEELRQAGLIGTAAGGRPSPGASSTSSLQGEPAQHGLYYGMAHEPDSPGSTIPVELQLRAAAAGTAQLTASDDAPGVPAPAAAGVVYGSMAQDGGSSSGDDSDFGMSTQQLFAAARRQLSQNRPGQLQTEQVQAQPAAVGPKWDARASVGDSEDLIDDIPEDFSGALPIEDLDMGDLSEVYAADATDSHKAAAPAAGPVDQLGKSMDLHETGLSLSDRLGEITHLTSADLVDEDDF